VAYDVFISYSSKDKLVADGVCARLESAGIRCWIAPRDIVPGTSYGEAIIEAIHGAKVMVLVFSSNANASGHIPKEVERAVSNGVAILPFRIEAVTPGKSLDYFIGSVHWLDAMTPPMEKHLDDLAATVHKLLPATAGEQAAPAPQATGSWQANTPATAPPAAPMAAARPAAEGATTSASSSKTMWIAVAAVVVLALVVLAVILLRGRGSSTVGADLPSATNSPGGTGASTDSKSAGKANKAATEPHSDSKLAGRAGTAAAEPSADPIVGCYQWFNNEQVAIHADGTMVAGPFTARWRRVSPARRAYTFTWPEATDTVTISRDQQSLKGSNQYGFPASGTRLAGTSGLVGTWRWPNGVPVIVYPNGAFSAATFRGNWRALDASRGIYTLTWPNPVDSVTLSADGSRVSGANQYGISISGVTMPCAGN
jgi:hypothetical protein